MAPMIIDIKRPRPTAVSTSLEALSARFLPRALGVALGCLVLTMGPAASIGASEPDPTRAATHSGRSRPIEIRQDLRALPSIVAEATGTSSAADRTGAAPVPELPTGATGVPDPLVGEQQRATGKATASLDVDVNVAGLGFTGATPADVAADIGGDRVVQIVNAPGGSVLAVFERSSGTMIAGPIRLESLWTGGGACAEGWGHAGVVFDVSAGRWLLHEIGAGDHLCVYVSQTADPVTGPWHAYDFELARFPDFPRMGVWSDSYIATTNEDLPAVHVFERDAMLAGVPAGWMRFTAPALDGFGFQALTPVDLDGAAPPSAGTGGLLVRHVDGALHGGVDRLELFELDVDWSSPQSSTLSDPTPLALTAFDSAVCGTAGRSCIPQPGTTVALDPVREVVSSLAHYRRYPTHESLIGSFTVDANGSDRAGIRWFELRRSGSSWAVHQEGTYSPDALHRWVGVLAADRDGNLALAFNVSDAASTSPSIRLTGRGPGDPTGVMTSAELELQAGTSPQTVGRSPHQWGWSTAMSVDPEDDCTFWMAAAFADGNAWNTRLASFRFPSCDTAGPNPLFADGFESGGTGGWSASAP